MFRVVLDTNVIVAAKRSSNPASPNREIIDRWLRGELIILYTKDVLLEYAEKLIEQGVPLEIIHEFLLTLDVRGEPVHIEFYHYRNYPPDADDIAFILCASNGTASHLVTYDEHLLQFPADLPFRICEPLALLADLRTV